MPTRKGLIKFNTSNQFYVRYLSLEGGYSKNEGPLHGWICFEDLLQSKSVSIGKVQQVKCDAKLNVVKGKKLPRFHHRKTFD